MKFEITHELDAPLDAVELAVLSPFLGETLARSLARRSTRGTASIESVETVQHVIEGGELRRVLRFQASAPLAIFGKVDIAREAMCWQEISTYRLADHGARWTVTTPREEWQRWFRSEGTYRLEPVADGRTRRTVVGEIEIRLKLLGAMAERMAVAEVRKTYEAEADTLRALATL